MMIQPEKWFLPNGITVLFVETHQSPVVSLNACFRVGSVVETPDEAGICHLIEHMIFKGTPTRPTGQIAAEIEAAGGDINAYTSFDETVYYCTLSSRYFNDGLEVLCDAIVNPLFDAEELEREKLVVIEEINRSEDTPSKVLSENLFKTVFKKHPYGNPIIGSRETVLSFTQKKLLEFYRRWYVAKNLVFVIAGDFNKEKAKQKIEALLGKFNNADSPTALIPQEPLQTKPRSYFFKKKIESHYFQIAFPIPELQHPHLPALDLLSHLLGEGLSSRLEQRIKEKKRLVDSIYSYAYTPQYPGLFVIGFTTSEKKVAKAAAEILKEIFALDHDRISYTELARAKTNIKSDAWYERETIEGLARKYGYFETIVSDFNFDQQYYQKIEEVDPSLLHEVVRTYLKPERLSVAALIPENSKLTATMLSAETLLKNSLPQAPKVSKKVAKTAPTFQTVRLKNGVTLILKEKSHLPLTAIRLINWGGVRSETAAKNGLQHWLAQTLTKGTKTRSAEKLANDIEQIAGSIDAFSGRILSGLQGDFLSEKLETGLELFCDVLLNPAFEESEIAQERALTLAALEREQDQLSSLTYKNFLKSLYQQHPYGLPVLGSSETVKALHRKDLIKAHREFLNPQHLTIAVTGDFDSDLVKSYFSNQLQNLKPQNLKLKLPPLKAPKTILQTHLKKAHKNQTHIALGFLGTSVTNPDRYALEVLNSLMAGQGGRLFIELRDKLSLAYTVTSFSQEGIEPGFFSIYIATEPQKTDRAIEGILTELKKVTTSLVSESELNRAQKYIVGSYEIELQRNANVANQMAFNHIYGLGVEEIERYSEKIFKVTRSQVLEVAKKYLKLDAYVLSVVGG